MKISPIPEDSYTRFSQPRCRAQTIQPAPRTRMPQAYQCKHGAFFIVDDKPLCKIHAGFELVAYALWKGGEI